MIRKLDKQDRVFRALGHATRARSWTCSTPRRAPRAISARIPPARPLHGDAALGVLERAGLVVPRTEGRLRWNVLNVLPIKEIHDRWIGAYAANASRLLARLALDLEIAAPGERASRRRA